MMNQHPLLQHQGNQNSRFFFLSTSYLHVRLSVRWHLQIVLPPVRLIRGTCMAIPSTIDSDVYAMQIIPHSRVIRPTWV